MFDISNFGKILIFLGIILIAAGMLFMFGARIPWLGKLPGDICIKKENFTLYFPLATSILLSIALSIIMLFIGRKP
jgi:Zn-dependent protease with chaperone function